MRNSKEDEIIVDKLRKRGFSLMGNILRHNINQGVIDSVCLSMSGVEIPEHIPKSQILKFARIVIRRK